jgi:hypothetical protein
MNTHPEGTHRETPAPASGDLLNGLEDSSRPLPDPPVVSGDTQSADRRPSGNGFADPTPDLDEGGRAVPCTVCGAGPSQPRIDYGLNTSSRCRPARQPRPVGAAAVASCGGQP